MALLISSFGKCFFGLLMIWDYPPSFVLVRARSLSAPVAHRAHRGARAQLFNLLVLSSNVLAVRAFLGVRSLLAASLVSVGLLAKVRGDSDCTSNERVHRLHCKARWRWHWNDRFNSPFDRTPRPNKKKQFYRDHKTAAISAPTFSATARAERTTKKTVSGREQVRTRSHRNSLRRSLSVRAHTRRLAAFAYSRTSSRDTCKQCSDVHGTHFERAVLARFEAVRALFGRAPNSIAVSDSYHARTRT